MSEIEGSHPTYAMFLEKQTHIRINKSIQTSRYNHQSIENPRMQAQDNHHQKNGFCKTNAGALFKMTAMREGGERQKEME